ncbi:MAG: PilZ domain-containing protein [Sandaracinaceae bacterium]|nr:PilZ domain-containing protein [Sandaracinaceae bacterium]MDW8247258.1 PilZ domain-containing protein [Sandaracinaceae bacterium]
MSRNRRLHERFPVQLSVTIVYEGQEIPASTMNISLGGMLVCTEVRFAVGTPLTIRVQLPDLKEPSELPAFVRWVRDGQVGVQFGQLRARDTWGLNRLLRNAMPST